jgi:hypothetical protein
MQYMTHGITLRRYTFPCKSMFNYAKNKSEHDLYRCTIPCKRIAYPELFLGTRSGNQYECMFLFKPKFHITRVITGVIFQIQKYLVQDSTAYNTLEITYTITYVQNISCLQVVTFPIKRSYIRKYTN